MTKKDDEFRKEVQEGSLIKAILKVCIPLALYSFMTQLFNILDTLMASSISAESVSTVVYMVQLQHIVLALGSGLSVGGGILVAHAYGRDDADDVRTITSTTLVLSLLLSILILIIIPFTPAILRASGTPEIFVTKGSLYFSITLLGIILQAFNSIYISNERCRGRSRKILALNISAVIIKLLLTAMFVYILDGDINSIALCSLISHAFIFFFSVFSFLKKDDPFSFSLSFVKGWMIIKKILKLSVPSMVEKIAFSYGKAEVNNMASNYGTETVGASGISNNMSGLITGIQTGFQDGGSSLEGQLYGSGNIKRTIISYRYMQAVILIVGTIGIVLMNALTEPVAYIFSLTRGGYDISFHIMICTIYRYELAGCFLLSFAYSSFTLLLATGRTKAVLFINFARIFLFRLPVIYYFQNFTSLTFEAVGYTMAISNSLVGILALVLGEVTVAKEKRRLIIGMEQGR